MGLGASRVEGSGMFKVGGRGPVRGPRDSGYGVEGSGVEVYRV